MRGAHKILVMTDVHIAREGERIAGLDPVARLEAVLEAARRDCADAERLIVMGDLVHRGSRSEYRRLRPLLDDLPWPVTLMLGNHDNRDNFAEIFPRAGRDDAGFVQTVIDLPGWRLICLDSHDADPPIPHSGVLCETRLAWLDAALDGAGDRRIVVFIHHPPFLTGFDGIDSIRLRDGDALLDRLRGDGRVRQLVAGHVHRTISGSIGGLPVAIFKGTCHQMPWRLGQPGTSLSVVEPGAYGLLLLGGDDVVVHTEDVIPGRAVVSASGSG